MERQKRHSIADWSFHKNDIIIAIERIRTLQFYRRVTLTWEGCLSFRWINNQFHLSLLGPMITLPYNRISDDQGASIRTLLRNCWYRRFINILPKIFLCIAGCLATWALLFAGAIWPMSDRQTRNFLTHTAGRHLTSTDLKKFLSDTPCPKKQQPYQQSSRPANQK